MTLVLDEMRPTVEGRKLIKTENIDQDFLQTESYDEDSRVLTLRGRSDMQGVTVAAGFSVEEHDDEAVESLLDTEIASEGWKRDAITLSEVEDYFSDVRTGITAETQTLHWEGGLNTGDHIAPESGGFAMSSSERERVLGFFPVFDISYSILPGTIYASGRNTNEPRPRTLKFPMFSRIPEASREYGMSVTIGAFQNENTYFDVSGTGRISRTGTVTIHLIPDETYGFRARMTYSSFLWSYSRRSTTYNPDIISSATLEPLLRQYYNTIDLQAIILRRG